MSDSLLRVAVTVLLVFGVAVCLRQTIVCLRHGRLWVDSAVPLDDSQAHELAGAHARGLAVVYLITAVGCVFALVDLWQTAQPFV